MISANTTTSHDPDLYPHTVGDLDCPSLDLILGEYCPRCVLEQEHESLARLGSDPERQLAVYYAERAEKLGCGESAIVAAQLATAWALLAR